MTSDSYYFAGTLAIEMYLGKHDAYSVLNTAQARWAAAILSCCDIEATSCGGTKCSWKKLPVDLDVDLYTLRLLILPKTRSKVKNIVFATHCTVNTLDVVHTGGHAVAISEIHLTFVTTSRRLDVVLWPNDWKRSFSVTVHSAIEIPPTLKLAIFTL